MTLDQLKRGPKQVPDYCEYVGSQITALGVADALGIDVKTARAALARLMQRRRLRITRRYHARPGSGRTWGRCSLVLEWVA